MRIISKTIRNVVMRFRVSAVTGNSRSFFRYLVIVINISLRSVIAQQTRRIAERDVYNVNIRYTATTFPHCFIFS